MLRKNKYNNIKVNGFDSKKENKRNNQLFYLQESGFIHSLESQKVFILQNSYIYKGNKIQPIKYIADFYYYDNNLKQWIIEDVKSKATMKDKTYILKKKLLLFKIKDDKNTGFLEYV